MNKTAVADELLQNGELAKPRVPPCGTALERLPFQLFGVSAEQIENTYSVVLSTLNKNLYAGRTRPSRG